MTKLSTTTEAPKGEISFNPMLAAALPSPYRGVAIIGYWLKQHDKRMVQKSPPYWENTFNKIFGDDGEHLFTKGKTKKQPLPKWQTDFGGWFLNLDNKNQVAWLNFISDGEIDLTFPDISNWKELGAKYGMDAWEEFTQEDVRTCCVGFKDISEWDAYPHDLVWLRKFVLYSENHSINNYRYAEEMVTGERGLFGCFVNWWRYYKWLSMPQQTELCKELTDYA